MTRSVDASGRSWISSSGPAPQARLTCLPLCLTRRRTSSVRALLRILEEKGHLRHTEEGNRYVYLPTQARQTAAKSALGQVVQTFFGGSVEKAVTTLLSSRETKLTEEEITRLSDLIERARADRGGED